MMLEKKENGVKVIIAYHNNCIDGFTSAWITSKYIKDYEPQDSYELFPMDYREESYNALIAKVTLMDNPYVIVVDFSLPMNVIELLEEATDKGNTILDHHKTAFERYVPDMEVTSFSYIKTWPTFNTYVHLDNSKSGAGICWEYFFEEDYGMPAPKLVQYVQDRDLWKFEFGMESKYIHQYLVSLPRSIEVWDQVYRDMEDPSELEDIIAEGRALYETYQDEVQAIVDKAVPVLLNSIMGLAVNCDNKDYASDVGNILAKQSGTFGAVYDVDLEAEEVRWSLRSDKANGDLDVSAIASSFGGGGHKNAAGFTCELWFDLGIEFPQADDGTITNPIKKEAM